MRPDAKTGHDDPGVPAHGAPSCDAETVDVALNGVVYRYLPRPGESTGLVEAFDGTYCERRVGYLTWTRDYGEIMFVLVRERYQRRGIATAMLEHARTFEPVVHSCALTPDGAAWAEAVEPGSTASFAVVQRVSARTTRPSRSPAQA